MSVERRWREQYTKFGSYENEIGRNNVRGATIVAGLKGWIEDA